MQPINIVLFGRTGSGKSFLGNLLAGKQVFEVGDTLVSKTSVATSYIANLPGFPLITIKIIDTPGFADNRPEMSQEQLLGSIVCFLKELGEGFHFAIYCIPAHKNRIDDYDLQEVKFMGILFGQGIFQHTLIAVTQANLLHPQERKKIYSKFQVGLPKILSTPGIGPEQVLFADKDDFQEMFVKPLAEALKNAPIYEPQVSKDIDPTDPRSIMKALAKPEMQEFMKEKEAMIENQRKQVAESYALLEKQVVENQALQQKSFEAQERYQSTLDELKQQLEQSDFSKKEMAEQYERFKIKQQQKLDEINTQIANQTEQIRMHQVEMEQKEAKILALQKQAEDLEKTRLAAAATASQTMEREDDSDDFFGKILMHAVTGIIGFVGQKLLKLF